MKQLSAFIGTGILILLASLTACNIKKGPVYIPYDDLKFEYLVGSWQAEYKEEFFGSFGIEILTINSDGTYKQVFYDSQGIVYENKLGRWSLEDLSSGVAQLQLEEGVFLPGVLFLSLKPTEWETPTFEVIDPARGESIKFSGKAILNILLDAENGLFLEHLPTGDPDSPVIIKFKKLL